MSHAKRECAYSAQRRKVRETGVFVRTTQLEPRGPRGPPQVCGVWTAKRIRMSDTRARNLARRFLSTADTTRTTGPFILGSSLASDNQPPPDATQHTGACSKSPHPSPPTHTPPPAHPRALASPHPLAVPGVWTCAGGWSLSPVCAVVRLGRVQPWGGARRRTSQHLHLRAGSRPGWRWG